MSKQSALAMVTPPTGTDTMQATPTSPGSSATETVPIEAPKPTPKVQDPRFEQLAKKEAALVKEREELKAQKDRYAKFETIETRLKQFEEMKLKDPVTALKSLEIGITDTDILNFLAASDSSNKSPEQKAEEAAQKVIKQFQDEQEKAQTAAQAKAADQALNQFKGQVVKTVTEDTDKYKYSNHYGELAHELILDTVAQVYEDTKELISASEAADMVEEYYREQDEALEGVRMPKANPAQPQPVGAKSTAQAMNQVSGAKPVTKTLSNKLNTGVSSTIQRTESREQKRERLMAQLRLGLKK